MSGMEDQLHHQDRIAARCRLIEPQIKGFKVCDTCEQQIRGCKVCGYVLMWQEL